MCSAEIFLGMVFNEIKCHVNTSLGLVGRMHPLLCPSLVQCFKEIQKVSVLSCCCDARYQAVTASGITRDLIPGGGQNLAEWGPLATIGASSQHSEK